MPRFGPVAVLAVVTLALAAGCRGNAGAAVPPPTGLVKGNPLIGPDGGWMQAAGAPKEGASAAPCASPTAKAAAATASAAPSPEPTPDEKKALMAASPSPAASASPAPCQ